MSYGYADDPIAAQVMLREYGPGGVGAVGNPYGADLSWLGPAFQGVTSIIGAGIQAGSAGKQAEIANIQAQIEAQRLAAAQQAEASATQRALALAAIGAVTLVGLTLLGGGFYLRSRR